MNELEQSALARLVHDLPTLMEMTATPVSADAAPVLDLARLDQPTLAAILDQAQQYAAPEDDSRQLMVDRPLVSIFSRMLLPLMLRNW